MSRRRICRRAAAWSTFALVSAQAPSAVILVRAERFKPNPATAADNAFQADAPAGQSDEETADRALAEMDAVAEALRAAGVRVHVFSDEDHTRPGQRVSQQLAVHARGRPGRGLPDVRLQPAPRAPRRRARAAQVGVPRADHRRLLRPRARRHLPGGHRRDDPRPRVARRVRRAQPPRRHARPRAVLHRLRLRADGLRCRRLRRCARLPHQRDRAASAPRSPCSPWR